MCLCTPAPAGLGDWTAARLDRDRYTLYRPPNSGARIEAESEAFGEEGKCDVEVREGLWIFFFFFFFLRE